jgi:hypothetical protein
MLTCRVSPRNTSRECAECGADVARYNIGEAPVDYRPGAPLFLCPHCLKRGNADRNASICQVSGHRYQFYLKKVSRHRYHFLSSVRQAELDPCYLPPKEIVWTRKMSVAGVAERSVYG